MLYARIFHLLACVVVFLTTGHNCHHWSSHFASGTIKYACTGNTAMLPWMVALNSGESIHDIQWHFKSPTSGNTETIAFYASGLFVPGPGYTQRVRYIPNAGIMLDGLTSADTGSYMVEVTGRNATQMWSLTHQDSLQVLDNNVVSSSQLQVVQQPHAVYDNATGEWMVDLTCGDFSFPTQPPFDVQWTSPSGNIKPSSHYANGQFHLYLTSQEISGQYSCDANTTAMCFSPSNSTSPHASVLIDENAARLSMLEAQFKRGSTATKIAMLAQQNAELKNSSSNLFVQNVYLTAVNVQLQHQRDLLLQEKANLTQKLSTLEQKLGEMKNASIPDDSSAGCPGLQRKLVVLDVYLKQWVIKLNQDLQALNTSSSTSDTECQEAQKILEKAAVQMVLNSPRQPISVLKQSLDILNKSIENDHNKTQTTTQSRIIFDAKDTHFRHHIIHDHHIILDEVRLNQGGGYNPRSGCFVAPESGFYLFMGSVTLHELQKEMRLYLVAGDHWFRSSAFADQHMSHQGVVHTVVHLPQGQRACLTSNQDMLPTGASFSGFLVQADQ